VFQEYAKACFEAAWRSLCAKKLCRPKNYERLMAKNSYDFHKLVQYVAEFMLIEQTGTEGTVTGSNCGTKI